MNHPFLYQRLGYVALGVTNVERSVEFYRDLVGLELTTNESPVRASFRCSDGMTDVALYQSDEPGLINVGLMVQSAAEYEKARAHFTALGYNIRAIDRDERQFLQIGDAFRLVEPVTGITFDFFHAMTIPARPFAGHLTKIQRLGHVVIKTTQFEQAWEAMEKHFGFVSSDYVEDKAVWMRCFPNPFHHSFAILKSDSDGLHHVNFMVSEIDDVGRARNRLMAANVPIVFGPGRHKPSGSVFLYYTDPDGMTMEFSFGMEEFPAEGAREPRMLKNSSEVMDLWGGFPKPEFASTGAIIKK